jgi:hypothetical protein
MTSEFFGLIGIVILILLVLSILNKTLKPETVTLVSENARRNGPCPGSTETLDTKDPFMPTHFPAGSQFKVIGNWYACHEVQQGDFVYLQYSFKFPPVVRTVYGIPGDHFQISKNSGHHGWNISINGKLLNDVDNQPHYFGNDVSPLLNLYTQANHGLLGPKTYIVFSETSPGGFDSGTLGVVNSDDFLGKVLPR